VSKLKRLAGETALYGLGSILPRVLNFLLVPLHTINMFGKAEYGQITKLYAFVGVINIVYMFGMETAFFRFATKPETDKQGIFNLSQTTVVFISLVLSVIFISFSSPIANALNIAAHPEFIIWLALTMFVDALVAIPFARLRLEKKALVFAVAKIFNVSVLIGLNYYFLKINFDPSIGIGYVFLANLIANSLFIIFFFKTIITWRPAWDKDISPQMLHYAYPVMITGVAGMINEMFSRSMLDWWLPENFYAGTTREEAGGIFGACYKFAVFMNLGIQAFRYAAEPFFFSNATDKNSPALFAKVNHYFVIVCCVVLLGISINMDFIKLFFIGEEYWVGLGIVPVLLLAYLFLGVYYNMSVWFKLTNKTHYGTIITLIGVFITVIGNFILIPVAGYMGSSIAALLCYFTMAVVCYIIGQRFFPIPYTITKDLGYIIVTYCIMLAATSISIENLWVNLGFDLLVVIIFCAVIFLIERKSLTQSVA
jgi:O-antigen/teichoic acid export membrane protein